MTKPNFTKIESQVQGWATAHVLIALVIVGAVCLVIGLWIG